MVDGIAFDGEKFVVVLEISQKGQYRAGLRQGVTENAAVVGELCAEPEQRGVDFQQLARYQERKTRRRRISQPSERRSHRSVEMSP